MTKDVLPNSRMQTYEVQRELVASYAQNRQLHYDMPYMLETATAILLHYVCTGERLYAGTHGTYTRCKEQIVYESEDHPVVVGDFSSEGLDIDLNHYTDFSNCYGVSCLRRFYIRREDAESFWGFLVLGTDSSVVCRSALLD